MGLCKELWTPKGFYLYICVVFTLALLNLRLFYYDEAGPGIGHVLDSTLSAQRIVKPFNKTSVVIEKMFLDSVSNTTRTSSTPDKSHKPNSKSSISVVDGDILKLTAPKTMHYPKPEYLPQVRNPCFYVNTSRLTYLSAAERRLGHQLTCLPLVYFIGVSKAGTSDFHTKLVQHQHLIQGLHKEAHFWNLNKPGTTESYTMNRYREVYQVFASLVENCCLTNTSCDAQAFTPTAHNGRATSSTIRASIGAIQRRKNDGMFDGIKERIARGEQCPLLTIDSTPRSIYDGNFWERDPLNVALKEPNILTADRIHHFVPNAKAILLLRNPIDRALSDYRFFAGATQSFSTLVTTGIEWWKKCLAKLTERRCAFGYNYYSEKLANLPGDMVWGSNGAGRLRLGMYIMYIRKWLEVFSKDNLLILNSDVYDKDPIKVLKEQVYPFLGLDPISAKAEENLKHLLNAGHIHVTKKGSFKPDQNTLKLLKNLYRPYNEQLVNFTGDTSFMWQDSVNV